MEFIMVPEFKSPLAGRFCSLMLLGCLAFCCGCVEQASREKESPVGKAEVGVGKKGKGYGNRVPILKPAATFWRVKEKIAFEIAIPKSLQLYEATHGHKPKTHDEFMEKIIRDGKIKLPELDEGLEYFYDAKAAQLMVRNQPAAEKLDGKANGS
ncbi:MAG: hypothetical protein VX768_14550 [Planctomycetota bacterium]|nr:hypothetical protein [Planctomycetota bacterium]